MNEEEQSMLEYRRKKFRVEVVEEPRSARFLNGHTEYYLRVTHNGYQWSSIGFLKEEAQQIMDALKSVVP